MDIIKQISSELSLPAARVEAAVELIDAGNTIPFISRYRKEHTGNMDDQTLRRLDERLKALRSLEEKKADVISSLQKLEVYTEELGKQIAAATTHTQIEDIYRPYRPKRKTRASVAKAAGLSPLADFIKKGATEKAALNHGEKYINAEAGFDTAEKCLSGALDIIAEEVSDSAEIRAVLRKFLQEQGSLATEGKNDCEDSVYKNYASYTEPVKKMAGHRVLAIDRGEKENFLKVSVVCDEVRAIDLCCRAAKAGTPLLKAACEDACQRLIFPSLHREIRNELTEKACDGAIALFSKNLRQLLLVPPIKGKVVLGLDPAYRTGCKIAVVDATGKVLDTTVVYPTPPQKKIAEAEAKLLQLIKKHGVTAIAIGNGTASKESEIFVADMIAKYGLKQVSYLVVSEAGASVYSASKLAAAEFPQFDVSLRSAVSIARRMQDPLAELVKIEPKAIGVGQYQHDMPKAQLEASLDGVVEDCVNSVGVDLNTASASLLQRVSGLSGAVAANIVAYREQNGPFSNRKTLLKVSKLGPKAYKQAAGFLRITDGDNLLDATAVHPESYDIAAQLLDLLDYNKNDIGTLKMSGIEAKIHKIGIDNLAKQLNSDSYTLTDIAKELQKPGRDPRDELPAPMLRQDILDIKDLKPGMELKGTVRNIMDFGAFVDIAVHQDGLVHISKMSEKFIKHPLDVVKVGDVVTVWVLDVDAPKKRISLSMIPPQKGEDK